MRWPSFLFFSFFCCPLSCEFFETAVHLYFSLIWVPYSLIEDTRITRIRESVQVCVHHITSLHSTACSDIVAVKSLHLPTDCNDIVAVKYALRLRSKNIVFKLIVYLFIYFHYIIIFWFQFTSYSLNYRGEHTLGGFHISAPGNCGNAVSMVRKQALAGVRASNSPKSVQIFR